MSARLHRLPDGSAAISFVYRRAVVNTIKTDIPVGSRSFDPESKIWYIDQPWIPTAISILRNAFGDVEMSDDRSPSPIRSADQVYAELHLLPSAPPALVQAAYRTLALIAHPDRGGSTSDMQRVNGAFESLKARGVA